MDGGLSGLDFFVSNVSQKLGEKEVFDYFKFLKDFLDSLGNSNLTSSQKLQIKTYLKQFIKVYNCFEGVSSHQRIVLSSKLLAADILGDESQHTEVVLHSYHITDEHWRILKAYGIHKFQHFGCIYRGGVARIIARVVLGIPYNPNEAGGDVDLYIAKELLPEKLNIANYFNTGTEGIKELDRFSIDCIAKDLETIDCSMNQLSADNDSLYISDLAIESLKTGIIYPTQYGQSLYGISSINIDGKIVFFPRVLYRLMKFVIEGKANGFVIDSHNINPSNLDILGIDNYIKLLVRKISAKSLGAQLHMYWRMQNLFRTIGIIGLNQSIFDYLKKLLTKEKDNESWSEIIDKEQFEANWLLHKLIKLVKRKISGTNLLEGYNFDDKGKTTILLKLDSSGKCNS